MSRKRSCFTEAHFLVLPSQSNVYGMCQFATSSSREKVLVASLNGDINLFEYIRSEECGLRPVSFPVKLKYIPEHAEVISIDAFTRHEGNNPCIVVGITFIEKDHYDSSGSVEQQYKINILTAPLTDADQRFTNTQIVTEGGLPADLESTPCQITHTKLLCNSVNATVFLVSTTDRRMHVFSDHCCEKGDGTYRAKPAGEYFPEFDGELEDIIFFVDIMYFEDDKRRLTCTGSQGGKVNCYIVDVLNRILGLVKMRSRGIRGDHTRELEAILKSWGAVGMGPVTSIRVFGENTDVPVPTFLQSLYVDDTPIQPFVHVLVSHALEVSSVYRDVMKNGLGEQITLQSSYNYDSVLCSCVSDVDFDGKNEIILGTYGQRILAYKFDSLAPADECTKLLWEHSLPYPIHSIMPLDLTGDGLKDLAVLSMRGLHILQKDITKAAQLIHERIVDLIDGFKTLDRKSRSNSLQDSYKDKSV